MEIIIYNSIKEISEAEWDSILTPSSPIIQTHRFLLAVEESRINDCRYFYPVVKENGKILAHICLYSISTQLDICVTGVAKWFADKIRKYWKTFLVMKTLECGTPVALGNTISFADNINKKQILNELCDAIAKLQKSLKINVVIFRDFYQEELQLFDNLMDKGYQRFRMLQTAQISIQSKSFDEHLSLMKGHYKRKINKNINKRNKIEGICLKEIKDFSEYTNEFAVLWKNIYDHATECKREVLTTDFFKSFSNYMKNDCSAIIFTKDNHLIGFMLLLFHQKTLIPMYAGIDYTVNKEYGIYFNLLYEVLRSGIQHKMSKIDMGITCLTPKIEIGAEVVSQYAYVSGRNRIITFILAKFFNMTIPVYKSVEKHVLSQNCDSIKIKTKEKLNERT